MIYWDVPPPWIRLWWKVITPEQKSIRLGRLRKLHERVIDTARSHFVGEWFSDGSGSSVFLSFWKDWGILWYNNPEKAKQVHDHYMRCTNILKHAVESTQIHPVFEPVWMHPENSRPYLVRAIPGRTFSDYFSTLAASEKTMLKNFFWKFINPYLKEKIRALGFSDEKEQFDIKPENILLNPILENILSESLDTIKDLTSKNSPEREEAFLSLLSHWYGAGAHIYLFDYGTWIKPDGTNRYGKAD